ncbi:MAG: nitroreductase family protein [Candidatus Altiarchaeota archaeon]
MDATEFIKSRRSIRAYTDDEVPGYVIDDVLDCARLAPTARNVQPWLIGAVTDKDLLARLGGMCNTGPFIADAGVCFAVFCLRDEKYYLEDGCAATMNIILACEAHGLGACWVAGDKKPYAEDVRRLLKVGEEYTLVALIPAGYPEQKPEGKAKKPLEEVSFKNTASQ